MTKMEMPRLSRPRRRRRDQENIPRDRCGYGGRPFIPGRDGLTFQTKTESAHFFKPKGRCRDFPDRDKYGATKKSSLRPRWIHSIPGCRRHHFPERGGDGATKKTFLATAVDTARPFIPGWRRPDFPDQDRVGAFFQTKREMPRFSRPRQIRRDQEIILAPAMDTFHTRVQTASFSRTRRRRRDQENFPCDRGGYGATLVIRVDMAHTKVDTAQLSRPRRRRRNQILATKAETLRLSRPRRKWRDSSEQGGEGATFQTNAETARPRKISQRPLWIRRDPAYQGGDGLTFQNKTESAHFFKPKGDAAIFQTETNMARLRKYPCARAGCGATFQTKAERRDLSDQEGNGATFQTTAGTARPRMHSSRPRWIRCDFLNQVADGIVFQTKAETANFL